MFFKNKKRFLSLFIFRINYFNFQERSNLHQHFLKLMMNYKFEELLVKKLKITP